LNVELGEEEKEKQHEHCSDEGELPRVAAFSDADYDH